MLSLVSIRHPRFQSQFVSQKNAIVHKEEFPMVAETVLISTYMDDSMDSVLWMKIKELNRTASCQMFWRKSGMYAPKWLCNSSAVLENIPPEDRPTEGNLDKEHLPSAKTLELL